MPPFPQGRAAPLPADLHDAIVDIVHTALRDALNASVPPSSPKFATIRESMLALNISRTELYRRIAAGGCRGVERMALVMGIDRSHNLVPRARLRSVGGAPVA
jgi:hypothetical protein